MREQFIPYELAVLAKENGFNEPCFAYFESEKEDEEVTPENNKLSYASFEDWYGNNIDTNDVCAPIYQQIIDWFDTKDIKIVIDTSIYKENFGDFSYKISGRGTGSSYYKTRKECMDKVIEIAFKLVNPQS